MGMMIHRAMARVNKNAPKEPLKHEPQVETVAEEAKPVVADEEEPRKGRPPKK